MKTEEVAARLSSRRGQPPLARAVLALEQAIARHERHMNGQESTSHQSQQAMMDEMRRALAALRKI